MSEKEIDELSGTETTGHEWDGIKELNTPLPRWWLWTFYGTVIWAIAYTVFYPAWPLVSGATTGILGYTSRGELAEKVALAKEAQAGMVAQLAEADMDTIVADAEMARFARAGGASLFKVNCSQCHGSGAQGAEGFPNLNDDEWIWGGTPEAIYQTIAHGVRYEDDDETRFNEMPVFGDDYLSAEEIEQVAGYVASLSGMESDLPVTEEGATLFADNCVACHGEQGEGLAELGGPPLNNAIWLYSDTPEGIVAQITNPKHGVMPAWQAKLGDTAVKQLAAYVHSLGGGQ
jgi:cytochrome c oxidase cbb3-type subunit 3